MWRQFHRFAGDELKKVFLEISTKKVFKERKAKGVDFLEEVALSLKPGLDATYKKQNYPEAEIKYIRSKIFSAIFLTTPVDFKYRLIEEIEKRGIRVVFPGDDISGFKVMDTPISFVRAEEIPKGYVSVMCSAAQQESEETGDDGSEVKRTWKVGVVVLNENGELECWTSRVVGQMKDKFEAGLEAIIEGIEFSEKRGYKRVIIESECETVVLKLNLRGFPGLFVDRYVHAWCLLNSFDDQMVKCIPLECNRAANAVAHAAKCPFEPFDPNVEEKIKKITEEDRVNKRTAFCYGDKIIF